MPHPSSSSVNARHDFQAQAHASAPPISAMLRRMADARELAVLRGVAETRLSRADVMQRLRAHVARVVPRTEIEHEDAFLKMVGVVGLDTTYEKLAYDAIGESIAGMYEPFDRTMYVPSDLPTEVRDASVAHESVHALQDQHFDLQKLEQWVPGNSDAMLARSCLAEGDATSATIEVGAEDTPLADDDADYIEREITAPYVLGTAFVQALRKRGGWTEVNAAWTSVSLTTEQILHPDKWVTREPALVVPQPTIQALGASAMVVASDMRGELGLRLVLGAAVPPLAAKSGAEGWGGDALVLVRTGRDMALAWRIRFDDEPLARAAYVTIAQAFSARACHVSRESRDVLVLVGPAAETCTRWSKEIFADRAPG
jgi:hypothetical protein